MEPDWASLSLRNLRESLASDTDARDRARDELSKRGRVGDERAIEVLIASLDVGLDPTQEQVVEWEYGLDALVQAGPTAIVPLIVAVTDGSRPDWVREGAARALGSIGDPRVVKPLQALLSDETEDLHLRRMVAFYIGRIGDHRVLDSLLAIATDRDTDLYLRRDALHGIEELRDPRAFDSLVALLHDPGVRNIAGSALQELRDPRALAELLPSLGTDDENWRFQVAAIVGKLGAPAAEPLLALLAHEDWRQREGAATALAFTGDRRAFDPLAHLARHDQDNRVRTAATNTLAVIDHPDVSSILADALNDDDVRVRLAAMQGIYHLALTGKAPAALLPRVEWIAETDAGMIGAEYPVRDAGRRAVREWQRAIAEKAMRAGDETL